MFKIDLKHNDRLATCLNKVIMSIACSCSRAIQMFKETPATSGNRRNMSSLCLNTVTGRLSCPMLQHWSCGNTIVKVPLLREGAVAI